MQDAQTIFQQIENNKKALKEVNQQIKEFYMQDSEFVDTSEKIKVLATKRKETKNRLNQAIPDLINKQQDLKIDIASDQELLSDIFLTHYTKGESVEIKDQNNQLQLPIFVVKFKKED